MVSLQPVHDAGRWLCFTQELRYGTLVAPGVTEFSGVAGLGRAVTMPAALVGAPLPHRALVRVHVMSETRGDVS